MASQNRDIKGLSLSLKEKPGGEWEIAIVIPERLAKAIGRLAKVTGGLLLALLIAKIAKAVGLDLPTTSEIIKQVIVIILQI